MIIRDRKECLTRSFLLEGVGLHEKMPEKGLEPLLTNVNGILNPARIPISPLRRKEMTANYL